MKDALALITFALALAFAAAPVLTEGFRGFTPGQFPVPSDRWPVVPAGWAFAIWGVIYLWLVAGAAWGLVRARTAPAWQAMRAPLCLSLAIGVPWIWVANLQPAAAAVMLVFMAATAIAAFLKAPSGPWAAWPVGLYAGWLSAATAVAFGVVLPGQGVLAPHSATFAALAGLLGAALLVTWRRSDVPSYAAAVLWALWGVIVANMTAGDLPVSFAAALGMVALITVSILRRREMQ
ncbi:tryptophan-rich sensory protein [Rhodobacter maris]|uniref:TspO/MBR related protein n=1 Tax=Rhodobacter maris TaxID=446682 RepID=A0A285S7Y6_9RHOB|nr:tryptophan-rich sensory protein [Rhodobacter maris]SOC03278.1 TspO/MBR related protein [Rhodobacter maris]